jgi:hypothetical protein
MFNRLMAFVRRSTGSALSGMLIRGRSPSDNAFLDLRRIPGYERVGGNILDHNGSRRNDSAISNTDSLQYN